MERLGHDLESARLQIVDQKSAIADQKEALTRESEKSRQLVSDSKSVQTALVDIKAETDAIKEQMKGWQKDYVTVLAQLEKKMGDSQYEIKKFEENLKALNIPELKENINSLKYEIEKMNQPALDNSVDNSMVNSMDNSSTPALTPDAGPITNSQAALQ